MAWDDAQERSRAHCIQDDGSGCFAMALASDVYLFGVRSTSKHHTVTCLAGLTSIRCSTQDLRELFFSSRCVFLVLRIWWTWMQKLFFSSTSHLRYVLRTAQISVSQVQTLRFAVTIAEPLLNMFGTGLGLKYW